MPKPLWKSGATPELATLMREYLKKHPESIDARHGAGPAAGQKQAVHLRPKKLLNSVTGKQRTPLWIITTPGHSLAWTGPTRPCLPAAPSRTCPTLWKQWQSWPLFTSKSPISQGCGMYEKLLKLNFSHRMWLLRLINISLRMGQPEKHSSTCSRGQKARPSALRLPACLWIHATFAGAGRACLSKLWPRATRPRTCTCCWQSWPMTSGATLIFMAR